MTCNWLVLIPTAMERDKLFPNGELPGATIELCGFGPIVAAARTTDLIAKHRPGNVLLVGIAGALLDETEIGSACVFEKVACYGIGVGSGHEFLSADELDWPQWCGNGRNIRDVVELCVPATIKTVSPLLLTVCSASAGAVEASLRLQKFPAAAEDMEGFGVAAACRLADITPIIVRGISNRAGNRNHDEWEIDVALSAARELVLQITGNPTT